MLGHLVALAARRWPMLADRKRGVALMVCAFAVMALGPRAGFDNWRLWLSVLCFAGALPGLFEATKGIRWMNHLGDLSYPLYLVHTLVLMAAGDWWLSLGNNGRLVSYASIAVFLAASTLAALAAHSLLEIPTAAPMRRALLRWPRPRTV